jgi:hypothetical protein
VAAIALSIAGTHPQASIFIGLLAVVTYQLFLFAETWKRQFSRIRVSIEHTTAVLYTEYYADERIPSCLFRICTITGEKVIRCIKWFCELFIGIWEWLWFLFREIMLLQKRGTAQLWRGFVIICREAVATFTRIFAGNEN